MAGRRSKGSGKDDDLDDLLHNHGGVTTDDNQERVPLNLDDLSRGQLDVPVKKSSRSAPSFCSNLMSLCCAYVMYIFDFAPRLCWCIGIVLLIVPSYLIVAAILNPVEHFGVISNDYSEITSEHDFSLGKIDHWCLKGDNDSCRCGDPLQPESRGEYKAWASAHVFNKKTVETLIEQGQAEPDIAFLGASIVEEMDGHWFGDVRDKSLEDLEILFKKHFQRYQPDGLNKKALDAVALGIAGDTSPTVLWRVLNGEMPGEFNPKIWWLEIGMNDLGRTQCSEEIVVLGVLRVVEEIIRQKPDARIVINSLFPMADLRGGVRPTETDYKSVVAATSTTFKSSSGAKKGKAEDKKTHNHDNKDSDHRTGDSHSTTSGVQAPGNRAREKEEETAKKGKKTSTKKGNKKHGKKRPNRLLRESNAADIIVDRELTLKRSSNRTSGVHLITKEQQKKYTAVTHKERKLPLWTSITAINKQLRKFALKHDQVTFFDATDIFTYQEGKSWTLRTDRISLRGHPTFEGFAEWEAGVLKHARRILKDRS